MEIPLSQIGTILTVIIAGLGIAVTWGKFTNKFKNHDEKLKGLDSNKQDKAYCESQHKQLNSKLDDIKERIVRMDESREKSREENAERLEKISRFMGRVEQFMNDS